MKPFLIITGMHRSGTSFLARALNLAGVNLGDLESLLSHEWKAYADNPRGHWENKKIYDLSEKILKNCNGSWHGVPKKISVNKKIGTEIKNCTQQLKENAIFASGFKEPRILVMFDSWVKFLPKNFVVVGIFRDPLKVAESLKNRDNFSYEKSLRLWQTYNQNLLDILDKYDGFLLDFDWSKKKLLGQFKLISKKLGLATNVDLSGWYTEDLLISDKTYQKSYSVPKEIKHLYSKLKKRSIKNQFVRIKKAKLSSKENSTTLEKLLNNIRFQGQYFSEIFKKEGNDLQFTIKKLEKLQKEFDERNTWAQSLDKQLKQKGKKLSSIQKEFDERNTWAQSLDKQLKQKGKKLSSLQKEFDERNTWAQSLNEKLKQTSEELTYRKNELEERSNWALSIDEQLKQKGEKLASLQKEFDERNTWAQSLDEQLKQKGEKLASLQKEFANLQKEFEERSNWALSLDEQLKQKGEKLASVQKEFANVQKEFANLQKEFEERSNWALSLDEQLKQKNEEMDKVISTKDSQLLNLQNENERIQNEINDIKNSVMFGITSSIARKLDKIAPPSTRRKKIIRTARTAYLIQKDKGTKKLLGATKNKIIKKKSITTKNNPQSYVQAIKDKKTKFDPDLIKIEKKFATDSSLRQAITFGSHNITNLSSYPKISIIIITYNQVDALKRNLECIKSKTTYKNYEIIIVTNNLDENSEMRKFLKSLQYPIHVFEEKYSFGGMNNFGASKAEGEYLLFLNDDVEITSPNWLEAFLTLGLKESTGVVGGKLLLDDGKLQDCGGIVWKNGNAWNYGRNQDPDEPGLNYVRDVDYCSGSCLFVRKEIFDKVGGFDRKFDPAYWEDVDLCFSIRKLGYKILYQPLATLIHYEGSTQGTSTDTGLKSYQVENLKKFQEKWKSVIDTHLDDSLENAFHERDRREGLNILYIDHYVPEHDKDAGSLRTFYFLGILAHMKNKITVWPDNQQYTIPFVREFQQKGIEVIYKNPDFDKFLEERKNLYDLVMLARPYISEKYIDKIKEKMPNCKIVYDTIDLHFLRMNRQAELENDNKSHAEEMRELELSLMKKSDITILTSPVEADFIHNEDSSLKFAILPTIHPESEVIDGFDRRKNMIFLGGFQHTPNIDSAEHLVRDIWPKIKKEIPDLKLYIVGSSPTENIKKLGSDDIVVTGFVKELEPFFKECKVMLAPIRFGAGIKGKITQSLAMGLPVVTSSLGAEGINLEDGKHCMIADSEEDFAKKAIEVYSDEKLWKKLSKNGMDVAKEYSPERAKACLEAIISSIF